MIPKVRAAVSRFWNWYEKFYAVNIAVAAFLFTLQILHLWWLTVEVVLPKIAGHSTILAGQVSELLLVFVDYTEIPALITVSLVYIDSLRRRQSFKDWLYLIFVNVQWFHIFWITDEVVLNVLAGTGIFSSWPPLLAWLAIFIDYLELPVIFETLKRVFFSGEGLIVFSKTKIN